MPDKEATSYDDIFDDAFRMSPQYLSMIRTYTPETVKVFPIPLVPIMKNLLSLLRA